MRRLSSFTSTATARTNPGIENLKYANQIQSQDTKASVRSRTSGYELFRSYGMFEARVLLIPQLTTVAVALENYVTSSGPSTTLMAPPERPQHYGRRMARPIATGVQEPNFT